MKLRMFNVMSEAGEIYESYINPSFIVVIEPSEFVTDGDFNTIDIITTNGTYKCIDSMKDIKRILE